MEDVRDYDNVEGVRCTKDVHDAASLSEAGDVRKAESLCGAAGLSDATGLSNVASLSETEPAEALRDAEGLSEAEFLAAYDPKEWPRPSMTADVVLLAFDDTTGAPARHTLHVLLIKRGGHPCLGMWAFPGGFMNPGETVGETAIRELFEETGIRLGAAQLRQLRVFSRPGRDPRTWVITCTHMAVLNSASTIQTPQAADDAQEACWFELTYDLREMVDPLGNVHDITSLVLRSGNIELAASVSFSPRNDEFRVIENTGLAFDHAEMLACAIQELETW